MRILKKKTSFITQIFWKLLTPKNVVTWTQESSRFRTAFVNQRINESETLTNSAWPQFYANFTIIQKKKKSSWKRSLLVTSEVLGLFRNTLTANNMNSLHNGDKSPQHLQTPFSSKSKSLSQFFSWIFEIYVKFCAFWKKRPAS